MPAPGYDRPVYSRIPQGYGSNRWHKVTKQITVDAEMLSHLNQSLEQFFTIPEGARNIRIHNATPMDYFDVDFRTIVVKYEVQEKTDHYGQPYYPAEILHFPLAANPHLASHAESILEWARLEWQRSLPKSLMATYGSYGDHETVALLDKAFVAEYRIIFQRLFAMDEAQSAIFKTLMNEWSGTLSDLIDAARSL